MGIGEGGYPVETWGAEQDDMAYRGLGESVPTLSRAISTTPIA